MKKGTGLRGCRPPSTRTPEEYTEAGQPLLEAVYRGLGEVLVKVDSQQELGEVGRRLVHAHIGEDLEEERRLSLEDLKEKENMKMSFFGFIMNILNFLAKT